MTVIVGAVTVDHGDNHHHRRQNKEKTEEAGVKAMTPVSWSPLRAALPLRTLCHGVNSSFLNESQNSIIHTKYEGSEKKNLGECKKERGRILVSLPRSLLNVENLERLR